MEMGQIKGERQSRGRGRSGKKKVTRQSQKKAVIRSKQRADGEKKKMVRERETTRRNGQK